MKIKQTILLIPFVLVSCAAFAQQAPTVSVKASHVTLPDGGSRYDYRVIDSGTKTIVGFAIGSDYYHGVSELRIAPSGWTFDSGLAQGTSASPAGWYANIVTTEESPFLELEWRNNGAADILPGQTRTGFSIITPQSDDYYLKGHWTAFFSDSTVESASLILDDNPNPVDNTPPTITVSLTPNSLWPPNGTMRLIQANVSVHDDQDPNPSVKLASITCNETLGTGDISGATFGVDSRSFSLRSTRLGQTKVGRIYTITYSATDASGNTATATATVTVPHDQRN